MLKEFESAANLSISYTNLSNESQNIEYVKRYNICVYLISIQMTEDMNEHFKGVIFISTSNGTNCYPKPLRYNITALQSEWPTPLTQIYNVTTQCECDCNQETETAATISYHTTSSSCKIIVERMLPLFCSLICLIFVIALR